MKRFQYVLCLGVMLCFVLSCSKSVEPVVNDEFIANLSDLAAYKSWSKVDSLYRTDNKEYRYTYLNNSNEQSRIKSATGSGTYSKGTILVKEIRENDNSAIKRFQIMVKRGGSFNPGGNGWEWFLVDKTFSTILSRGGDTVTVNGLTCKSCHTGQNDLVFQHPPR